MSEWVDFTLYALQAALLWIVLPAWGARFLRPAATVLEGAGSRSANAWITSMRVWGITSLAVLLAYRLERIPAPLSATALHRTGWEMLLTTSNLLLALGLLVAGRGAWLRLRLLRDAAAQVEQRPADTFPLTRDDLLSRRAQYGTYGLVLLALVARPLGSLLDPLRVQPAWGTVLMGLALAVLLFFLAAGSVMRAPNVLDRTLGERWRQLEVRLCYLLMAGLALLELAGLALELAGLESRRHVALLVTGFVSMLLAGLMLLSARRRSPIT